MLIAGGIMAQIFISLKSQPVLLALLAGLFTWGVTALGAALVFFFKTINKNVLNGMLGFASGVMIAASFFSLLLPAVEMSEQIGITPWIPAVVGFGLGGFFLWLADKIIPHMHFGMVNSQEGLTVKWKRSILLVLAITLHNIPEGFAVGVAIGAAANGDAASFSSAMALALGIGLQNFPEGAAVSIPLRREGMTRFKSFMYGQASGIVEPISAVIGVLLVTQMQQVLPYALAFAAGAMIYVVIEELIPEAQSNKATDIGTIGAMLGFALMMFLDIGLG